MTTEAKPQEGTPLSRRTKAALIVGALAILLVGLAIGRWTAPDPAHAEQPAAGEAAKPTTWTCSMHPQIRSPNPGACPICGMDLIPVTEGGGDMGPRELKLTPRAVTLSGIETEPVTRREASREARLVGKVDYDETRLNYITAWVPGRLDRLFVDYTGTLVSEKDHLVEIYSPELLTAQEELIQALAAREKLRDSDSELLKGSADATVASSREKLRLWGLGADQIAEIERTRKASDHLTIRAPIGGVVIHKNKNTGDYVKTGERLYTIADLSQLWIKLDAYESDLSWVRYGQTVEFSTEAYPGVSFKGRVVFVDPVLTGNTRTVKVRLNVDNSDGRLKPGMFVRAVLRSSLQAEGQTLDPALADKWICPMHWDVIKDAEGKCDTCGMPLVRADSLHRSGDANAELPLLVPASAVLWTGVRSLVYVRVKGEEPVFRGQEVVLGPRAGDYFVVRDGLKEGQLVVTKGAFKIDSALQIEARPSMMLPPEDESSNPRHDASPEFLLALDPIYTAYLRVQAGLAADDLTAAKSNAESLGAAARRVDMKLVTGAGHVAWMGHAKRLRDAAKSIHAADSIERARTAFGELSATALDLERQFGHREGVLREAHCPMAFDNKGGSWIQREEQIANPYFGASMLRCGEIRSTFSARGETSRQHQGAPEPATRPVSDPVHSHPAPGEASLLHKQLDAVLEAYFALQRDLAADTVATKAHVSAMRRALQAVQSEAFAAAHRQDWSKVRLPALGSALDAFEKAEDLDKQRAAFEPLSAALDSLVVRYGHLATRSVRRFHCPMAFNNRGANWLQEGEQTLNPYFGSQMLRCGSQQLVLPPEGTAPATPPTSQPTSRPAHEHQHARVDMASFRRQLDGLLAAYFALQRDLAADKAAAGDRVGPLRQALTAVKAGVLPAGQRADWTKTRVKNLSAAITRLERATTLSAQREAFEDLSTALDSAITRYGHSPGRKVRRFRCPMAFNNRGANWLQEGKQTLNPYFGSQMLRCGSQVTVLPAEGQGD